LRNGVQVGNTVKGSDLTAPIAASGNQLGPNSNAYITFSNLLFDEVILSSSGNSFEFSNVAAAAPEPATWAMMILGFIGLSPQQQAVASSRLGQISSDQDFSRLVAELRPA
jgi:hypothetical protein